MHIKLKAGYINPNTHHTLHHFVIARRKAYLFQINRVKKFLQATKQNEQSIRVRVHLLAIF